MRMRFLNDRIVTPSTSTSTISNGAALGEQRRLDAREIFGHVAARPSGHAAKPYSRGMTACRRSAISCAQSRNTSRSPPAGSSTSSPRFELDLVQLHRREPVDERRAVVGQVAREPLQRRGARRGAWDARAASTPRARARAR